MNAKKLNGNGLNGHAKVHETDLEWDTEGSSEWEGPDEFLAGRRREIRNGVESFFLSDHELSGIMSSVQNPGQNRSMETYEEEE